MLLVHASSALIFQCLQVNKYAGNILQKADGKQLDFNWQQCYLVTERWRHLTKQFLSCQNSPKKHSQLERSLLKNLCALQRISIRSKRVLLRLHGTRKKLQETCTTLQRPLQDWRSSQTNRRYSARTTSNPNEVNGLVTKSNPAQTNLNSLKLIQNIRCLSKFYSSGILNVLLVCSSGINRRALQFNEIPSV